MLTSAIVPNRQLPGIRHRVFRQLSTQCIAWYNHQSGDGEPLDRRPKRCGNERRRDPLDIVVIAQHTYVRVETQKR